MLMKWPYLHLRGVYFCYATRSRPPVAQKFPLFGPKKGTNIKYHSHSKNSKMELIQRLLKKHEIFILERVLGISSEKSL